MPVRVRSMEGLGVWCDGAMRMYGTLAAKRWAVVRQERPTKDMIAMYSLERWTRTSFVCLCLWLS